MGQILIRNLDDELIADYREAAERNNRSLEAEVREALRVLRPKSRKRTDELIALAHRISAMTPKGVSQTPSEVLVREDRDGKRE
jgi:plasmid stability protein